MRVLFLTEHFPPKSGGTSTYCAELTERLALMGVEVDVVSYDYGRSEPNPPPGREFFGIRTAARMRRERLFPLWAFGGSLALARKANPDIVHVGYGFFAAFLGVFVARLRCIPVIFTLHNIPPREMVTPFPPNRWVSRRLHLALSALLGRFALALGFDALICPSNHIAQQLFEMRGSRDQLRIIAHGVSSNACPAPEAHQRDEDKILCVGAIATHKGQKYLIGALPAILKRHPTVKIVLAGEVREPAYAETLSNEVVEKSLVNHVDAIGYIDRDQLMRQYRSCGLYVQPSLEEGFCLTFLEALAAGCAAIGTRTGAIPEMVDESGAAVLVEPGDSEALAEAVVDLMSSPERLQVMRSRALHYAQSVMTWENTAVRTRDLYLACLRRAGSKPASSPRETPVGRK